MKQIRLKLLTAIVGLNLGLIALLLLSDGDQPTVEVIGTTALDCGLNIVERPPPKSVAVIGHAYGAPGSANEFVSPAVESFLIEHSGSLEAAIFSGDVFQHPTKSKWDALATLSEKTGIALHVAPGNHDVGGDSGELRQIWEASPFGFMGAISRPLNLAGFTVVLEDSIRSNWQFSPEVFAALKALPNETPIALIRHNISVAEMERYANWRHGLVSELPDTATLETKLPAGTVVISGDTGAFPHLPRVVCAREGDLRILASGTGDHEDDGVLLLSKGKLSFIRF